jgi:peptidoglycan/LPS O-acetylase OafA/YrhL
MKANVSYLSNLTPLRGIAALLTVIYHVDLMIGGGDMLIKYSHSMVLSRMYLMVDFFFILSGFIMCHVYGEMFAVSVKYEAFKKFTIARFARVYPLHFVMLFYTIILWYVSAQAGIPKQPILQTANNGFSIITNLLLVQSMNLHNWFSWVHASWSISVEWWAYMLFPFLVAPFSRLSSVGKITISALCIIGYLAIMFYLIPLVKISPAITAIFGGKGGPTAGDSLNVSFQFGYVRCLCGFILGMMVYQGYKRDWGKNLLGNGYTIIALALCSFACMHFTLPDVFAVSFFPFILLSGAYGSKRINKVFGTKALQKLGDLSFTIYLVHQPLIYTIGSINTYLHPTIQNSIAAGPPPKPAIFFGWLVCFAIIALSVIISYFVNRFVELPARHWLNPKKNQKDVKQVVQTSA